MKDKEKTKGQLIKELEELRQRIAELESVKIASRHTHEVLRESARLNELLLDSMPHPAMLIRRDRIILAANRIACEVGARVGGHCWRTFGRSEYIPDHDKQYMNEHKGNIPPGGTKCTFCLTDELFEENKTQNNPEVKAFGQLWDTWWVPIENDVYLHYAHNITERKQVEETLRKSAETARALLNAPTDSAILLDASGTFLAANTIAAERFGKSVDEIIGLNIDHVVPPELAESRKAKIKEVILSGKPVRFEDERAGRLFDNNYYPIFDGQGNVSRIAVFARDNTEQKRMVEALRESEKRFRDLFDDAPVGYYELDTDGLITSVNRTALNMLGYTIEEMLGRPPWEIMVERETSHQEFKAKITGVLPPGKAYERTFRRKDGTTMPILAHNKYILNKEGQIVGLRTTIQDITERKQVENSLQESEERFRRLVELSPDGICIHVEGRVVFINSAGAKILGAASPAEVVGRAVLDFVHPDYKENTRKRARHIYEEKTKISFIEEKLIRLDGTIVDVETAAISFNYQGKPAVQIVVRDITERKQAEEKLLDYQGQLRSLASEVSLAEERERRRIATELHDRVSQTLGMSKIKLAALQELTSCTGFAGALEEIKELVDRSIQDMRSLTLELSPPVLYELGFEAALEWLAEHMLSQHGIYTEFENDGQPQKSVPDDVQVLLFQATRELLFNVAKHARADHARISVRKDSSRIRITVEDNGAGLNVSELGPHVNKNGGFGLFSIRERLEHLGGHIEIESEPGSGTRVTLVAPLKCKRNPTKGKVT